MSADAVPHTDAVPSTDAAPPTDAVPHPDDAPVDPATVAWASALDELERLALTAGEATPTSEPGALASWAPPVALGPLPAVLADRAAAVAATQRVALARVDAARLGARRHLDVVRTVEASHQPERPVYLDATG